MCNVIDSFRELCIRSKLSAIDAVVRRTDEVEWAGWKSLHRRDDG